MARYWLRGRRISGRPASPPTRQAARLLRIASWAPCGPPTARHSRPGERCGPRPALRQIRHATAWTRDTVSHEERSHRKCVHSIDITHHIQAHSASHQHLTSQPTVPVSTRPPRLHHHLLHQRHPHGTASSRGVRLVLQQATCMHGGGAREQGCGASRSLVNPHHPLQPRPLVIQHARSSRLRPPYRRRYVCRCSRSAAPRRKRHVTACDDV